MLFLLSAIAFLATSVLFMICVQFAKAERPPRIMRGDMSSMLLALFFTTAWTMSFASMIATLHVLFASITTDILVSIGLAVAILFAAHYLARMIRRRPLPRLEA